MNITLPKRDISEIFYPADAAGDVATTSTSWEDQAWNQIVDPTATPFVLCGAVCVRVITFTTTSVNENLLVQTPIAVGAAGSEVEIARSGFGENFRYDAITGSVTRLNYSRSLRFKPVLVPQGSRLSWKALSSAVNATSVAIHLLGFNPADGFPIVRPFPSPELYMRGMINGRSFCLPEAGTISVDDGASNWVYGSWVEFEDSMPNDALITGLVCATSALSEHYFFQVGVGASGQEVALSGVPVPGFVAQNTPAPGLHEFIRPIYVKKGERLVVRAKGTVGNPVPIFLVGDYIA